MGRAAGQRVPTLSPTPLPRPGGRPPLPEPAASSLVRCLCTQATSPAASFSAPSSYSPGRESVSSAGGPSSRRYTLPSPGSTMHSHLQSPRSPVPGSFLLSESSRASGEALYTSLRVLYTSATREAHM